jgi:hypothetical protein
MTTRTQANQASQPTGVRQDYNTGGGHAGGEVAHAPPSMLAVSIICAIISLGVVPPLFGAIALYAAYRVYRQDPGKGAPLLWLAGGCALAGMVIDALMWTRM